MMRNVYKQSLRKSLDCAKTVSTASRLATTLSLSMVLTPSASANIVGNNSQNFNATSSVEDYVTVYSSKTLGAGRFSLGLFIDNAVNSLPYFQEAGSESHSASRGSINDVVTTAQAAVGYGIAKNIDLGIVIPAVIYQSVKDQDDVHGQYASNGVTDIRIGGKIRLLEQMGFALATALSANISTIKNSPYEGSDNRQSYNIEIIADYALAAFDIAANLGYKLSSAGKSDEDPRVSPFKNQILASAALGYKLPMWNSKFITEVFTSAPTQKEHDASQRHTTRAEALAGLKIFYTEALTYHVGAGSELRQSTASADWRLYGGVNYTMGSPNAERSQETASLPEPHVIIDEKKPDEIVVVKDVLFKFNSDQMAESASEELSKLVMSLKRGDGFEKVIIEGHTCNIGGDRYNRTLSKRRAQKVKAILVREYGIPSWRIDARGLGKSRPIATNKTEDGRRQNRRTEFKIYRKTVAEQYDAGF